MPLHLPGTKVVCKCSTKGNESPSNDPTPKVRCITNMEVIQLFQHPALPCGVKLSTPITVTVVKFLPSPTPGNVSKPIAWMNFPGGMACWSLNQCGSMLKILYSFTLEKNCIKLNHSILSSLSNRKIYCCKWQALQKNLNKLSRVRKAQKKKQQQKSKGLKQG